MLMMLGDEGGVGIVMLVGGNRVDVDDGRRER